MNLVVESTDRIHHTLPSGPDVVVQANDITTMEKIVREMEAIFSMKRRRLKDCGCVDCLKEDEGYSFVADNIYHLPVVKESFI